MSTDYFIFLDSDHTSTENVYEPLLALPEVEYRDGLQIRGLFDVSCEQLDNYHREVMREDYGEYGLDVNWLITGTYDKETDINEVVRILIECAALLVNASPDKSLSLMRNGESFYVFNTRNRLILSKICIEESPLFKKSFMIKEISY